MENLNVFSMFPNVAYHLGITLSALWTRLKDRPNFVMVLDAASKQFLWEVCILQPDVDAYILPEPRPPLVIFNRFANVDPETGLIVEPVRQ